MFFIMEQIGQGFDTSAARWPFKLIFFYKLFYFKTFTETLGHCKGLHQIHLTEVPIWTWSWNGTIADQILRKEGISNRGILKPGDPFVWAFCCCDVDLDAFFKLGPEGEFFPVSSLMLVLTKTKLFIQNCQIPTYQLKSIWMT